ncbi:MAG: glutathione S-transferase family protein [Alphaproteobacteria bacterium]
MALTLYDCAPAPNPRRARIFLAEKGIEHEVVQIDLANRQQLTPEYQAINPFCTVPALKTDDGTVLTENIGIATFAEALKPDPALLGKTPVEKGLIFSWNARMEFDGLAPVGEVLRNTAERMAGRALPGPHDFDQIPALAERGRARIAYFFDMLNARLEGRSFIATDDFTLADITALVAVDFAKWVKAEPKPEHTALAQWRAAVSERPSAKA